MNDIIQDISKLSPEKKKLLELLLKEQNVDLAESKIIPASRETNRFPLSYAQQRMWFLEQLEPGTPLYNNPAAVMLTGQLDIAAMQKTLDEMSRRHEVLRTTFASEKGKPVQIIHPELKLNLEQLDLSELPPEEREKELKEAADKAAQHPFDLGKGPLLRTVLIRLDEQKHVLLLTMHHIISDAWTLTIFIREVAQLYEAFSQGKNIKLPPLPIQYADFARWQHDWLKGRIVEEQIAYWKANLSAGASAIDLPADHSRPKYQTFNGDVVTFTIDENTTKKLEKQSQQHDVTLFMTLLAALDVILSRYSGETDISVGTPIAGRNRTETEFLMGVFVNTLVMRVDLSDDPTFAELLHRVKDVALGAYSHQDVPFEMIVEALKPQRDMSRTPFFQTMFVLQNAPAQPLKLSNIDIEPLELHTPTAKFDLTLVLEPNEKGMDGQIVYNTNLFEKETITRFVGHLLSILTEISDQTEQRISTINLLTDSEKKQLAEWSHPKASSKPGNEKFVHELFADQAARTPDRLIVCNDDSMTYHELDERSNRLAGFLVANGVKPEQIVGLFMERSLDLLVGLMAILKSGGVYLPLDPDFPRDRIAFMLHDAGSSIILSTSKAAEMLPENTAQLVCVDSEWEKIQESNKTAPNVTLHPQNSAYIIYTSGSTGKPKGVLIPHGEIAEHSLGMKDFYELTEHDRVLQFASTNFDASLEQIFPTLMAGAELVLRGKQVWSPEELIDVVKQHQLTVVNLPTAYWTQFMQTWAKTMDAEAEQPIRLLIVGGDLLTTDSIGPWCDSSLGKARLLNAYGPTEATITSTIFDISASDHAHLERGAIPIGRGVLARSLYILDKKGNPVPVGIPGELVIGGFALARGYLNRPDITAEKFVPDPFSKEPGARFYRTGDLVRYRPGGNIQFLGRIDDQVKIRGYRIELGEIESNLIRFKGLSDVAVIAKSDSQNNKQLVAYYVPENGLHPTINELRDFLMNDLPDYMIPTAFVELESFPMTQTGKIDRRALPDPDQFRPLLVTKYVAPRTKTEKRLAEIVAEVLKIKQVGVFDNFFELGGHSMLGTQVISQLREEFHVDLPLRALFENPTVEGIARAITEELAAGQDESELEAMLDELDGMSDEEIKRLLDDE